MKPSISFNHVSKQYGKVKAVSDLSFSIWPGQVAAFLGPNGAGKSTTMNLLSALLSPTSGKIKIEGHSMDKEREQMKWLIGVVFQEDILDNYLTVYQNLYYRGSLYYPTRKQVSNRIEEIAEMLAINGLLAKRYGSCSGGQKRICQISRALIPKPKLLLLDEPTIGLDPIAREFVWNALFTLNQKYGMTIFFSTHYMEEIAHADYLCMIKQGHMLLCGTKDEILRKYAGRGRNNMQEIYMELLREDSDV